MNRPEETRDLLGGAVRARRLLRTPLVDVVAWRCLHDGEAARAPRRHDDWVLTVLHDGTTWVDCAGWSGLVDPTRVLLHPPGTVYRVHHPLGCGDRGCNFRVRADAIEDAIETLGLARPPERSLVVALPEPPTLLVSRLLGRIAGDVRDAPAGPIDPLEIEERVLDLVVEVLAATVAGPRRSAPAHRRIVERVQEVVALRYAEPLDLAGLARSAHASPSHLSRVFRRATGCSVYQYVRRRRMIAALDRILDGDERLDRIAHDTGFASHAHLTSTLRDAMDVAPSELRRTGVAPPPWRPARPVR